MQLWPVPFREQGRVEPVHVRARTVVVLSHGEEEIAIQGARLPEALLKYTNG